MQKFIAIIFTLLLMSCDKEVVQPDETITGENTFSFKFNETVFVPNVGVISYYSKYFGGPSYLASTGHFQVGADNRADFGNHSVDIYIEIDSVFQTGVHDQFNYNEMRFTIIGHGKSDGDNEIYYLDTTQNNWINFTELDTISPVISAQFEFHMIDFIKNKTVHISDGRFDFGDYLKID